MAICRGFGPYLPALSRFFWRQTLCKIAKNGQNKMKIIIFDLDETVIDSKHRTPNFPDGTLNLEGYIKNHTPANVAKDRLLPIARLLKQRRNAGDYIIILTAREMHNCDHEFLQRNGLQYDKLLSRNDIPESHYKLRDGEYKKRHIKKLLNLAQFKDAIIVMFDDAKPVKSALRSLFPVLCAHKINKRLGN